MDSLIKKTKIPNIASTLVFEIWPPDFLAHKDVALNLINKMRDTWGVGFAMFDVINTSILKTCVKQAGFEFIKFKMDNDNLKTISEISEAASELGVLTVVEQISNAQQLNSIIEMGFDYGQGDFIQPPMDQLIMADVIEM
jgi:EAL domain-containing protein (putative c-di-GMP-specific phosphodiesterase class I)